MVNEHGQIICDTTGIILEDHVCLLPGYVTVQNGQLTRNYSDDPNNKVYPTLPNGTRNPEFSPGMLTNRKEFRRIEGPLEAPDTLKEGLYHFEDLDMMYAFVLERKRSALEASNAPVTPEQDQVDVTPQPDLPRCTTCEMRERGQNPVNPDEHFFNTSDHPYPNPNTEQAPPEAVVEAPPPPPVDNQIQVEVPVATQTIDNPDQVV